MTQVNETNLNNQLDSENSNLNLSQASSAIDNGINKLNNNLNPTAGNAIKGDKNKIEEEESERRNKLLIFNLMANIEADNISQSETHNNKNQLNPLGQNESKVQLSDDEKRKLEDLLREKKDRVNNLLNEMRALPNKMKEILDSIGDDDNLSEAADSKDLKSKEILEKFKKLEVDFNFLNEEIRQIEEKLFSDSQNLRYKEFIQKFTQEENDTGNQERIIMNINTPVDNKKVPRGVNKKKKNKKTLGNNNAASPEDTSPIVEGSEDSTINGYNISFDKGSSVTDNKVCQTIPVVQVSKGYLAESVLIVESNENKDVSPTTTAGDTSSIETPVINADDQKDTENQKAQDQKKAKEEAEAAKKKNEEAQKAKEEAEAAKKALSDKLKHILVKGFEEDKSFAKKLYKNKDEKFLNDEDCKDIARKTIFAKEIIAHIVIISICMIIVLIQILLSYVLVIFAKNFLLSYVLVIFAKNSDIEVFQNLYKFLNENIFEPAQKYFSSINEAVFTRSNCSLILLGAVSLVALFIGTVIGFQKAGTKISIKEIELCKDKLNNLEIHSISIDKVENTKVILDYNHDDLKNNKTTNVDVYNAHIKDGEKFVLDYAEVVSVSKQK